MNQEKLANLLNRCEALSKHHTPHHPAAMVSPEVDAVLDAYRDLAAEGSVDDGGIVLGIDLDPEHVVLHVDAFQKLQRMAHEKNEKLKRQADEITRLHKAAENARILQEDSDFVMGKLQGKLKETCGELERCAVQKGELVAQRDNLLTEITTVAKLSRKHFAALKASEANVDVRFADIRRLQQALENEEREHQACHVAARAESRRLEQLDCGCCVSLRADLTDLNVRMDTQVDKTIALQREIDDSTEMLTKVHSDIGNMLGYDTTVTDSELATAREPGGGLIRAIKAYRIRTGTGLADAKRAVEQAVKSTR